MDRNFFRSQITKGASVLLVFCLLALNLVFTKTASAQTIPNLSFLADIYGGTNLERIEYPSTLAYSDWGGFGVNAHTYRSSIAGGDQVAYAIAKNTPIVFSLMVKPQAGDPVTLTLASADYPTGTVDVSAATELHFVWDINQSGVHVRLHRYAKLIPNDLITVKNIIQERYQIENLGPAITLTGFSEYLHMDDTTRTRDYNNDGRNETLLAINNFSSQGYPAFGKVYLPQAGVGTEFVIEGNYAIVTQTLPNLLVNQGGKQNLTLADFVSSASKNIVLAEAEVAKDAAILLPAPPPLVISHVEVTQGIQDEKEPDQFPLVPLVAEKTTFVRVYISCGSSCSAGKISGTIQGPGGTRINPHNTVMAKYVENWQSQRDELGATLNFTLPLDWTKGTQTLTIQVKSTAVQKQLTFIPNPGLDIAYIRINDGGNVPDLERIKNAYLFAQKLYPISKINYPSTVLPTLEWKRPWYCTRLMPGSYKSCLVASLKNHLNNLYSKSHGDFLFGWLPIESDISGPGIFGEADAAWWKNGKGHIAIGRDDPSSDGLILAHEIAHLLDRRHMKKNSPEWPCDENSDPGSDWPFPSPNIFFNQTVWGLDGDKFAATDSGALKDPSTTYDYMSYCGPKLGKPVWTSTWTYKQILEKLKTDLQSPAMPNIQAVSQAYFRVSGVVSHDGAAVFDPIWVTMMDTAPENGPAGTSYCVEAQDINGNTLMQYCFDLEFGGYEANDPGGTAGFNLMLPFTESVKKIALTKDLSELVSQEVSANSPTLSIISPNGGDIWDAASPVTITWTANDLDGDSLSFNVYYSPDGMEWLPLGIETTDTQLTVNVSELPGSANARIRVEVSDGINTASDQSDAAFTVGTKAPQTTILSPGNNENLAFGSPLMLEGQGYDVEDGLLGNTSLSWTSSIDGALGTGSSILTTLSPGQHTITLTATDSSQNTGSSQISLNVLVCRELRLTHNGHGEHPIPVPDRSPGCPEGSYVTGTPISLSAAPDINWGVISWIGTNRDNSTATTNTLTMPAADHFVTVNYVLGCFAIETSPSPVDTGIINVNQLTNGVFETPPQCQDDNQYPRGATIRLTGVPNSGYTFHSWAGNLSGTANPANITMSGDRSVSANFAAILANTDVFIGGKLLGSYDLPLQGSTRQSYLQVNEGPVKISRRNNLPLIGAERVIYKIRGIPTSFTEMMALPNSQLSNLYWLPWYNNVDLDTQLRLGNVTSSTATINVYIANALRTPVPITLAPGQSTRVSFSGVNNGPVKIVSNVNIVAAERVLYKVNGVNTSFSEMMALPNSHLNNTYWLPWYNNKDLDTQLRFANVTNLPATVHVYIGGIEMSGSPFTLSAGTSTRKSFAGINNGPVKIVSNVNIVAAERVIYKVNGVNTSFSEMMALPNSKLSNLHWLPWYNNRDLDTQLRVANVSDTPATVHVYIGGQEMSGSPFNLAPGASTRKSFAEINNGPVKIESDVPIVVAERVIYRVNGVNTSFSEMMALPSVLMDSSYWLPWYNNVDLDTQLRFGVP